MRIAALVPALLLAACGSSAPPVAPPEAARLRDLARSLATALEAYGGQAASLASRTDCRSIRSGYEARVGPAIEGIRALATTLDPWMREHASTEHADLACAGAELLAEFERHTDIACTAVAMEANRAEASTHRAAMDRWVRLVAARADEADVPAEGGTHRAGPRCGRFGDGGRMYLP
jgi:hypothetical protein